MICGAAGRDFHDFNVVFRENPATEVVAFTATQIPGIDDRRYPPALSGELYPDGIPIVPESTLADVCAGQAVDEVVFAYSDVDYHHVMRLANTVLAAGADFTLLGPKATQIRASVPVISVCAVRTGCGKSQVARYLTQRLARSNHRVAALRHPMPYGDLSQQAVQRFVSREDLDQAHATLEEREEYEPYIEMGGVIYAGVDYWGIVRAAEAEADLLVWDGGNNDFSFIEPDLNITVVDALRPEQLDTHHPGFAVLKMADVVVVNKVHAATPEQVGAVTAELDRLAPNVPRVMAASPVTLDDPGRVAGARVMIVEDGPTITHGGMPHGAGFHAVQDIDDVRIVDPRQSAAPEIAAVFRQYDHIGPVLPAMGYGPDQLAALADTINAADIDLVVAGTPIDLACAVDLRVPVVRARYAYQDTSEPGLMSYVEEFLEKQGV